MNQYEPVEDSDNATPIEALGLSVRTTNALWNNNIRILGDLLAIERDALQHLSGFGQKAYEEVQELIHQLPEEILANAHRDYSNAPADMASVPDEVMTLSVDLLGLSIRTTNALMNAGVTTVEALIYTPKDAVRQFPGMGAVGMKEIYEQGIIDKILNGTINTKSLGQSLELHDFFLTSLKPRQASIVTDYYGLTNATMTLDAIGQTMGVTRERIRQIIKSTLRKIKAGVASHEINPKIFDIIKTAASEYRPMNLVEEVSTVYVHESVIRLYADLFPEEIAVYRSPSLASDWLVNDTEEMGRRVDRAVQALKAQTGLVKIDELARAYDIDQHLLYDMEKVTIQDGLIVLNTNKRALGNDRAYEIGQLLEAAIKPLSIYDIAEQLQLDSVIVRSTIYRMPGVVNVGPSMYALEKHGYTNKDTADIIHDYLREEGSPVHMSQIISYVKRYRLVTDSAVHGAIGMNPELFTRLDDGYIALAEWGYEGKDLKNTRLEVPAAEAFMAVLAADTEPRSQKEILERVVGMYGSRSTGSAVTIASTLKKMVDAGTVTKLGAERAPYYTIPTVERTSSGD